MLLLYSKGGELLSSKHCVCPPIERRLIRGNFRSRYNTPIRYIVIHDTGNHRRGADALAHFRYFNGGYRGASAHYFVDERWIVQIVDDRFAAWHCGDGRGRFGITNSNSIGIELCINDGNDMEATYALATQLIIYLMDRYNIPLSRVVRHYDASRKICPRHMSYNRWHKWYCFKENLRRIYEETKIRQKD